METLSHILCVRCYSSVGKDTEVLLCNSCHLWQHRKCSKGVSEDFYVKFYLASVLGLKQTSWICHYCSQHQQRVKGEPEKADVVEPAVSKVTDHTCSLKLPPKSPSLIYNDNSGYESDSSSFDEFSLTCDIQQNDREGPQQERQHTQTDIETLSVPDTETSKIIIKEQPIFSDTSRQPTLYTLYMTTSGEKNVKDNLGNEFTMTEKSCDAVALYKCARAECGFRVRVCEAIKEFLSAGSQSANDHTHDINSNLATNRSITTKSILTNYDGTLDTSSSSSEDEIPRNLVVYNFNSSSSENSDNEDLDLQPLSTSLCKFAPLNKSTPKCTWYDSSFTASESTDKSGLSALVDLLDEDIYSIPSSPASTVPALHSSDSEDENITMTTTTYHVTVGTRQGERDVLTDSHGYTYNIKFKLEARTFWCCTEVSKQCPASVIQGKRGKFTRGVASHNHSSAQSEFNIKTSILPSPKAKKTETDIYESDTKLYYEVEACLPMLKKQGSVLVSSDGFIFKQKVEDSENNITRWYCSERASGAASCKACIVFSSKQPFCVSTTDGNPRTWFINRTGGNYTFKHNHAPDYSLVSLVKIRMMIQKRISLHGMLNEAPNMILQSIFKGLDYKGQVFLDNTGNPFLTRTDKDYLPYKPLDIKTLKTFIGNQKKRANKRRKLNDNQ